MNHNLLKLSAQFFSTFKFINFIARVDENLIKIALDREEFFIDLTKGKSEIYMKTQNSDLQKSFQAPFDRVLQKRFMKSQIEKVFVHPSDRILEIVANIKGSYKSQKSRLLLEFTGKYTNAIILDEDGIVLEALRHISETQSSRVVKAGQKLEALPKTTIKDKPFEATDLKSYFQNIFLQKKQKELEEFKNRALKDLQNRENKFLEILKSLESEDELNKKIESSKICAMSLQANIGQVDIHDKKELEVVDFHGEKQIVPIPKNIFSVQEATNYYFSEAKKLKRKIQNIHKRRENISENLEFLKNLKNIIESASSTGEIDFYMQKKEKKQKSKMENDGFEVFFVGEAKIIVGKNQKQNIKVLQAARADDLWFHVRDVPSSHVILKYPTKNIPQNIIEVAAKLCIDFSGLQKGAFEVDFAHRKFVKITEGSNVVYSNYKTISIKKE